MIVIMVGLKWDRSGCWNGFVLWLWVIIRCIWVLDVMLLVVVVLFSRLWMFCGFIFRLMDIDFSELNRWFICLLKKVYLLL